MTAPTVIPEGSEDALLVRAVQKLLPPGTRFVLFTQKVDCDGTHPTDEHSCLRGLATMSTAQAQEAVVAWLKLTGGLRLALIEITKEALALLPPVPRDVQ